MTLKNDQDQTLYDYIDGKINYTALMNIFLNDRTKNWYGLLGKYFLKKAKETDAEVPEYLQVKDRRNVLKFLQQRDKEYESAGIMFVTALLDKDALEKMFKAQALYHDEFGEGLKGLNVERKYNKRSFASYFVTLNDVEFHIGFDHRGTSIEVDTNVTDADTILKALYELIDVYFEVES